MITVTDREKLRNAPATTSRFVGSEHGADTSFFWVDAPTGSGAQPHHHPYSETWVVLAGSALITADSRSLIARAGSIVTVGAGTVHGFRCEGPESLEMLCIHASPQIIQTFVAVEIPVSTTTSSSVSL